MSIVLIDARAIGEQVRRARKMLGLNTKNAAALLKITIPELRRYEAGRLPMPPDLLCTLLHRGFALSMCKMYNVHNVKK
ncbi:MAG: helix-turn-helix domain-containing protein [Alphaproteobacteria bacterium]|nr:helix-turn-helix domain-containing protein [Alphaproteobacteria bacterium]